MWKLMFAVICSAALHVSAAKSQELNRDAKLASDLSQVNDVPLATTLTDLVTKSSANSISSGILNPVQGQKVNLQSYPSIESYKSIAAQKGYVLRNVELDPRFQRNVSRVSSEIKLQNLTPQSRATGWVFPNATNISNIIVSPGPMVASAGASPSNKFDGQFKSSVDVDNPGIESPNARDTSLATADASLENDNSRVFGGAPILPSNDAFQDSVALLGNNKICSGVLVANDTIITAAHCYCDGVMDEAAIGTSIVSPLHRIKIDKSKSEVFKTCDQIKNDISGGDVAILKLSESASILPRSVGDLKQVKEAASVRAVGFGRTSNSIGFKYQVNIMIASYQCDGSAFSGLPDRQIYNCRPSHELVAAGLNRDTCGGDSGGPIYVFGDDAKPYVVGITSRAITPTGQCGNGGIYVLLGASPIKEWLLARGVSFN